MKVNKLVIGAFALVGFLVILFLAQSFLSSSAVEGSLPNSYEELTDSSYRDFVKDNYSVYAIEIPNNASFANEVVPVTNTDVKERLERELHVNTYWHSQTFLFHKRAGRWFPII
jgi:membrane-bound lytic murein transglycosylase D